MKIEVLKELFFKWSKTKPNEINALPLSGSDRKYFRISNGNVSALGVFNTLVKENEAYFAFTKHFSSFKIPVPNILSVGKDKAYYLVEDLGDDSLYGRVVACNGKLTEEVKNLYKKSLKHLVTMQVSAGQTIDYSYCYPVQQFDAEAIKWDLNYFKYNFLKISGIQFNEHLLEKDFDKLTEFLMDLPMNSFMFRDFQSRNIMIKENEPYFIDFQGGREGPKAYDVASLLYQAKAQIPYETREELFEYYYTELNKILTIDYDLLQNHFKGFALLRTLQVLGAYGLRGIVEKKPHFIESIPYAIRNLKFLLLSDKFDLALPHLKEIANKLEEPKIETFVNEDKIIIRINSFSYRKEIPTDPSSNGGGFVFDCRGIHNPGRYDEYKSFNGKNEKVIQFFKEKTDIDEFVQNTIKTIEPTIKSYIERKFNHLMISYGCTGGQHRSVYSAQALFDYLKNNYDVHLVLHHIEQEEFIEHGK